MLLSWPVSLCAGAEQVLGSEVVEVVEAPWICGFPAKQEGGRASIEFSAGNGEGKKIL